MFSWPVHPFHISGKKSSPYPEIIMNASFFSLLEMLQLCSSGQVFKHRDISLKSDAMSEPVYLASIPTPSRICHIDQSLPPLRGQSPVPAVCLPAPLSLFLYQGKRTPILFFKHVLVTVLPWPALSNTHVRSSLSGVTRTKCRPAETAVGHSVE